ncbi:MAG: hypothetical protein IJI49_02025 [Bacilli bacterium]|nr:hypothetical protein [Bacilli bacterium]
MNKAEEKKNFFYIVMMILTLVTVIIGAAFAVYTFLHSQKEGSTNVYTGTLSVEYISGTKINLRNIYPINNPNFNTTENVYKNTFRVKNTGTLDGVLRINIDITANEFSDNSLKYKVYSESGNELTTGSIASKDNFEIINNVLLESNSTSEYTILIWLDETGENQNVEMRRTLLGSIRVDLSQKRD